MMEKVAIAKGRALGEGSRYNHLLYPLRQCDGKPRFCNSLVGGADKERQAHYGNGS